MNLLLGFARRQPLRYLFTETNNSKQKGAQHSFQHLPLLMSDHLRFDAGQYQLYMVPKHPRVETKDAKKIRLIPESIVMEFHFLDKRYTEEITKESWTNSKIMKFKFESLGKILDIEPGKGRGQMFGLHQILGETSMKEIYNMKDSSMQGRIQFSMKEVVFSDPKQQYIENVFASISYDDFETMREIIRESLYDLSGLRLQMDIRRLQELQKVKKGFSSYKRMFEEGDKIYEED